MIEIVCCKKKGERKECGCEDIVGDGYVWDQWIVKLYIIIGISVLIYLTNGSI